jgi:hypothetical protein
MVLDVGERGGVFKVGILETLRGLFGLQRAHGGFVDEWIAIECY